MNMSKAVRRQLLGAGLVRAVTGAATAPDATPEVVRQCRLLDRLADQATDFAMAGQRRSPEGKWILDAKAERQRQASLRALMQEIGLQYEALVDVRDITSTALRWIEDLRDQLPVHPVDRRITWADIAGNLQQLYDLYDPDRAALEVIDRGCDRGGDLQRVSGVW